MIKNKFKIILKLSDIFLKDSYNNMNIINKKTNRLNKKSIFLWMISILTFAIFYISQEVIKFLIDKGLSEIFLNIYFFILAIFIIFQTSLVVINLFYFSKDLEYILPLPIKPTEILISKFISLMCMVYLFEVIFGIIPITIYGIYSNSSLFYYFYEIIILIIFPIFLSASVSIIMMFVMKISKFVKNKDTFQIGVTFILVLIMTGFLYGLLGNYFENNIQIEESQDATSLIKKFVENNKIKEASKYFLVINPSADILLKSNWSSLIEIFKIIFVDLIAIILFIFIGKKNYLKDVLINNTFLKTKKTNQIKLEKKLKIKKIYNSYIFKEIKTLYRNPIFFIQCIFPVFALTLSFSFLIIRVVPEFRVMLENEDFRNYIGDLTFDITAVYIILGIIQFFFMLSPTSLIAVSREGKNAFFMKNIPVSLYRQFIYKGIPQIIINLFPIIVLLCVIHFMIPEILLKYIIEIFILAILLNIINSYSMLIVDFLNPKINWDTEYEVLKQNKNKIFQYFFTVIIIVFLILLNSAFENINLDIAIFITGIIFTILILVLMIITKKKDKKIFRKIY